LEQVEDPVDVYHRDTQWITECQAMVTEVSTPSHGVGYEIGYALSLGKPVLCLHQSGIKVSKMITGNQDPLLQISKYQSGNEIPVIIRNFLGRI
jgi:nucleoside 2-deoxyribosyltransferase